MLLGHLMHGNRGDEVDNLVKCMKLTRIRVSLTCELMTHLFNTRESDYDSATFCSLPPLPSFLSASFPPCLHLLPASLPHHHYYSESLKIEYIYLNR